MFHLRVLPVLLSFLLVSDASSVFQRQSEIVSRENSEESEIASRENSEQYETASIEDLEKYQAQCGISNDTIFNLEAAGINTVYVISSYIIKNPTYRNNQNCRVQFRTGATPITLILYFQHFDIELHSRCEYDSLCVNGVKMCGFWQKTEILTYVVPAYSSFTMKFKTDHVSTRIGFNIKVYTSQAWNDTSSYAPVGIRYTWNTDDLEDSLQWIPQGNYVDACEVENYGVNNQSNPIIENESTEIDPIPSSTPSVEGLSQAKHLRADLPLKP